MAPWRHCRSHTMDNMLVRGATAADLAAGNAICSYFQNFHHGWGGLRQQCKAGLWLAMSHICCKNRR